MKKTIKFLSLFIFISFISIYFFTKKEVPDKAAKNNYLAVVLPHHDVVKDERLTFWQQISQSDDNFSNRYEKIFLLSPDHFSIPQDKVYFDNQSWETSSGLLNSFLSESLADYLPDNYIINSKMIRKDHGITSMISEIKENFPNAEFLPILIGQQLEFSKLEPLQRFIDSECKTSSCLLIASVDFSHYLPNYLANLHDLYSEKQLRDKLINQDNKIEVDSPQSLFLLQEFARSHQLDNWWYQEHTNSSYGDPSIMETTSHIFGAYLSDDDYNLLKDYELKIESDSKGYIFSKGLTSRDKESLGERLFYGADYTDTDLSEPVNLGENKIIIEPSDNGSSLSYEDNFIHFKLDASYVLGVLEEQVGDSKKISLYFYPLEEDNGSKFFSSFVEANRRNDILFSYLNKRDISALEIKPRPFQIVIN
jgi:AmmeMemoRadiSam system protein B